MVKPSLCVKFCQGNSNKEKLIARTSVIGKSEVEMLSYTAVA